MRRVAEAMSHAHSRGILHRDLKPANILLSDDGQPMLLDFNVSGEVVPGGVSCLTVGGTLPYMSPEQLRSVRTGDANDARSDIYSFGLVFYELLTGVHPFSMHRMGAASTVRPNPNDATSPDRRVESITDSVERVLAERESSTPNVRADNSHIPQGLANIVAKCLQPAPTDRYSTAEELCEDLRRHECNQPLLHAGRAPMRERFQKWVRRHPKLTSATAVSTAAAVILSVVALFAFVKSREVAQRDASITARDIHQTIPKVRVLLTSPSRNSEVLAEGNRLAKTLLETANHLESTHLLSDDTLRTFRSDVAELNFLINHSQANLEGEPQIDRDAFRLTTIRAEQPKMLAALNDVLSGRAVAAVAAFEESVHREPLSFPHRLVLANVYVAAGQLQQADEAYTVCVSIDPESFLAVFNRGLCRLDMQQYTDAVADFSAAVELRPTSAEAFINRGLARKGQGDHANAEKDISAAIQLQPDWARPYFIRSRIRKNTPEYRGSRVGYRHRPPTHASDGKRLDRPRPCSIEIRSRRRI